MSDIAIGIRVDRSELHAAIKELQEYKSVLGSIGGTLPGMEQKTLPGVAAGIQQMQQMQGVGGRTVSSDLPKQMAGLDSITKRIATNLQSWQTAASKARAELKQLQADIKGLEKASHDPKLAPSTRGVMLDELQQMEARRKEVEKEALRADRRIADYQRRLPENWQQQQQQSQQGGNQQEQRNWSGLRRLMNYGLVAAGGYSLGSFIAQSRSDYRQSLDYEGPLWARGTRGSRERAGAAAGLGVTPSEMYGIEDRLSLMGLSDRNGIGRHAMLTASFAKSQGVDVGEATKLRESLFAATGDAGNLPTSALLTIGKTVSDGFDKSRVTMLLGQIEKSTGISAAAMHGAGLSKQQLAADVAFALAGSKLDGEKGVFARSQELGGVMQNGLQGAGTGAGDIRLFQALDGFSGPMTWEKIHEMNVMKQGGFMQRPDLMNKVLGGLSGSKEARAGQLETMFPQWNLGAKGSSTLLEMFDSGFFTKLGRSGKGMLRELESQAKGGNKQAAEWLQQIKDNQRWADRQPRQPRTQFGLKPARSCPNCFSP